MSHDEEQDPGTIGHLDPPIRAMIEATNRGDRDALLAAFADDATLTDFGRTFTGKAEIARWNDNENIGVQSRFSVTSVDRSGGSVSVGVMVAGNGHNGGGSFVFDLDGDHISRMLITA
ncbi:MAG: hypothetical protein AVDCRST_MAG03-3729 [uncultured Rubrobacteraceae bacterium]|uniref:SnoaL-like domain-containing protein n=1 Tax=uncultured Rubrobacteraceae bacterium TaxID=349277 RepID=A0A6J4Q8B6_9ACTN|nr:MAG: hypothetical protein AVDCRST_MAG03-3729 [uncultured Rubrobacteraceae bacterium]